MSLLIVFPIKNCETRITPFLKSINESLNLNNFELIFVIEEAKDESLRVLKYEQDISKSTFQVINPGKPTSRGETHQIACEYAVSRNINSFTIFNEGWQDNSDEFFNIFQTGDYKKFDLYIGCRHVYEKSMGSIINILCNILFSIRFSRIILETKADSINIFRTEFFESNSSEIKLNTHFIQKLITKTRKDKLAFTVVDNGLNYPSLVKLNLKYFLERLLFICFKIQR